eukprot:4374895-Pyramimonas_sp.AAC.1
MVRVMTRGDSSVAASHTAIKEMAMTRNEFLSNTSRRTFLETLPEGSSFPTLGTDADNNQSDAP